MQQGFGISIGLLPALEHEITRGLEGNRPGEILRHWMIGGIACILFVHHGCHALHRGHHLRLGADAVAQPVGDVLGGDAQRGAVFHQAHIVDVRHLGAADTHVDPAHDIAEDALGIVVQFLLDVFCRPVGAGGHGDGQDVVEAGARAALQLLLHGLDVHLVIMRGMQRRRGGRGHPGRVGARLRVGELHRQHDGHVVRDRPHALADLRVAGKAAEKPRIDVPVLIGLDPWRLLHVTLADHGACFHGAVDLVAGAVKEAGVDEHDPLLCGADAFLEVDGGAPLLVHDADLERIGGKPQRLLDAGEDLDCEGHFVRPMHLGLHDVHGARARVHAAALRTDVVDGDQRRHHGIHHAFRHLVAVRVENRRVGHQMADIAHQHQRAAGQRDRAATRRFICAVWVEAAGEAFAAFLDLLREVALHQAQPVAVDRHLVGGIHRRNGILAVHDGGERGFEDHVGNPRLVGLADQMRAVDHDLGMKPVIAQQHGGRISLRAPIALELPGLAQTAEVRHQQCTVNEDARNIRPFAPGERERNIEEVPRPGDDAGAAHRIVALALLRAVLLGDGVGAVKRVIK